MFHRAAADQAAFSCPVARRGSFARERKVCRRRL